MPRMRARMDAASLTKPGGSVAGANRGWVFPGGRPSCPRGRGRRQAERGRRSCRRRKRMTDQSDKPKLGTRPPLGLKRTVETGKVKQSFSHGRSNTVVVEVKKRRILGRPGGAPA